MAIDKSKKARKSHEAEPEQPVLVITDALKVDSYNLRTKIQEALKDITFDLEIKDFTIKARAKPEEPEDEND